MISTGSGSSKDTHAGVEKAEEKKKKKEDTRTTESEDNVATVPQQRRQKDSWDFATSRIKSVSARIQL